MSDSRTKYIWRCAKCSYHFVNISQSDGILRQEKKCPKCKSLNMLTLNNSDITLQCKVFDPAINGYCDQQDDQFPFPT